MACNFIKIIYLPFSNKHKRFYQIYMKKIYLTTMMALCGLLTVNAQVDMKVDAPLDLTTPMANENVFGYCIDECQGISPTNISSEGVEVALAIYIPENTAQQLKGNTIDGLRVAFNNRYRRDVSFFIMYDLEGDTAYSLQNQRLQTVGWNNVEFDEPFEITGEAFYVGYRYHFFNSLNVSMAYFDRVTMNPNACWSNIDNRGWNNTDLAEFGALGLQLLMSGNASIGTDISMLDIIMPTSAMTRRDFTMQSIVRNMGNTPIDGYNLYYSIDGGEEVAVPLSDRTIAANATDTVSTVINIDEPDIATHDITVRVETEGDPNADNNSLTESILIYTTPVARKALLEEFTGMECAWCAEASDHIDTYLKQSNVDTSTVIVAHHVYRGNYYDYYSNENSIAYSSYFGMTGAPQMMINRSSFDGQTLMYDVLGYNPGTMVGIVLNRDCFTALSIETEYDEATRELNITVPVHNYAPLTGSNPTLNVWLTEDGQINWQNSGSGIIQNYEHNHVMRVYVTPAEGDPIETGVGVFEKTYTVTIPEELEGYNADSGESWKGSTRLNADNMHVVAFISNFDTNNPFNCGVINANICEVGGSVNAIEDVVAGHGDAACNVYSYGDNIYVDGTNVGIDVYTLSGTLVKSINTTVDCVNASDLQSGLYIIKVKTSDDGESMVRKVLLK